MEKSELGNAGYFQHSFGASSGKSEVYAGRQIPKLLNNATYVYRCDLFNDAASSSHISSKDTMING
jgi:hypothetical protein